MDTLPLLKEKTGKGKLGSKGGRCTSEKGHAAGEEDRENRESLILLKNQCHMIFNLC